MTLNKAQNKVVDENDLKPAVIPDKATDNDPEDGNPDEQGPFGTASDPEVVENMDTQDIAATMAIKYEDGEELDINKKLQEEDQG